MKKPLTSLGLIALTLTLYAGLFLLGWGLGDLGGFFSELARAAYIVFIVLMALVTPYISTLIPEGIGDEGARREAPHAAGHRLECRPSLPAYSYRIHAVLRPA